MAYALPVWTFLLWTTRIRNILADDGSWPDLLVPVAMTVLGVVALVDRRRGLPALAVATIAVWAVRVPLVLVRDHDLAFTVVHLVLAVVSVGLAALTLRTVSRSRRGVPARG